MAEAGWSLNLHSVLLWGFVATGVLTTILEASQRFGWSRMSLPFMLGTVFSSGRRGANIVGFLVHFLNGWLFAFFYAFAFEDLRVASWWVGALLGIFHSLMLLTVFVTLLPLVHPRMADERQGPTATRWLEPPGFLALNYGRRTPLVTLLAHLLYGIILGAFYGLH